MKSLKGILKETGFDEIINSTISCSDVHIALFDADHKHIQSFLGSNTKNKNGIVCNAFTGSCINCNHRIENDFSANLPVSELQCSHNKYLLYFPIGTNNKKKGYFIVEGIKYERINNKINIESDSENISKILLISSKNIAEKLLKNQVEIPQNTTKIDIDSVPEAIYIMNSDGIFLDVNSTAEAMYGYTKEEFRGKTPEFVSAKNKNSVENTSKILEHVFITGEPQQFEYWGRRKNGEEFPKLVAVKRGEYNGQRVLVVSGIDISEKFSYIQSLETSERNYREIFHATGDAIFIHNAITAKIEDINESCLKMFGYDLKEEVLKLPIEAFSKNDESYNGALALKMIEKARTTGKHQFEWISKRKNGTLFWSEVSLQQSFINRQEKILALVRNIDDRKKAELGALKVKNQFETLFQKISIPLIISRFDSPIPIVNQAFKATFGYTEADIDCDATWWIKAYPNEKYRQKAQIQWKHDIDEACKNNCETVKREYVVTGKDGSKIPVEIVGKISEDFLLVVLHDLRKQKENERALNKKTQDLELANKTKDKFFSIIAHDLRGPFNALLGFSDILKLSAAELDRDLIEQYATIINDTAQQSFNLLENLLEWAGMQQSTIAFNPETHILSEIVDRELRLLNEQAAGKSIYIKNHVDRALQVLCDKHMIGTTIRNLVNNAIKFSHTTSCIEITAKRVIILNHHWIKVTIKDHGVGIAKENIRKLFQMQHTFSTDGTQKEKGCGFGLVLCKEFIDMHNGLIFVESKEGKGTRISFTIRESV